ncbi:MAG: aldo/keto reductase [Oligoflexales bacterium]|nr:aldo/keto reductase [Oligoflexales bacterium]
MDIKFLYGTAWKEESTSDCVFNALNVGYRAIDTANQRKHYNEPGVGDALLRAYKELDICREDLFIQTKFTFADGQDHRKPYNVDDPYEVQVRSSVNSSLKHLHTNYLDSLILHGPYSQEGICEEDKVVWRAMETLCRDGIIKKIGISNMSLSQLEEIYKFAEIKPKFAQIRCFAARKWERKLRDFCRDHQITFQGFSLLTANKEYLGGQFKQLQGSKVPKLNFNANYNQNSHFGRIVSETRKTPAQIIFKFCHQIGILPITGTTTIENMRLNLEIDDFELSKSQVEQIENIAFS